MTDANNLEPRKNVEILSKMTIHERVEYFEAFEALQAATTLLPSYDRALAIQQAKKRVARMEELMAEAERRRAQREAEEDA